LQIEIPFDMTLGERTRQVRNGHGWSQAELARRVSKILRRKVTQVAIHHIESRGDVSPRFVVELAQALGVNLAWLQHGRGAMTGQIADQSSITDNQPTPPEKTQRVFISHSGDDAELAARLLDKVYELPATADEKASVITVLQWLKKGSDR
jgi:transcriptional regulator with XRE-family HTH domain